MKHLVSGYAALAALFAVMTGSPAVAQDGYGSISGQFILDGEIPKPERIVMKGDATVKDAAVCAAEDVYADDLVVDSATKGVANIFVYMQAKDAKKLKQHPSSAKSDKAEVVFDQKGCRFLPHCLIVRSDQRVLVKSDDAIAHNTHGYLAKNDPFNFLVAANDRKGQLVNPLTVAETLPMPVKCDIHPWMRAHWLVVDHPFAALTDKEGKFTIENLPAGEHSFRIWHERAGYLNRDWKVTVKKGEKTAAPAIKVPVADLNKPAS